MNRHLLLPADPKFPGMAEALNAGRMHETFRSELQTGAGKDGILLEGCVPEYVRYKPGVSCIIGYSLRLAPDGNGRTEIQRAYGRLLPPDEGRVEYEKALKTHTAAPVCGPPVAYFRELPMVVSFFPNDRSLRGLRFMLDPDKLKRIAQEHLRGLVEAPWRVRGRKTRIDVLSYKPERHCVARCRLGLRNVDTGEKRTVDLIGKLMEPGEGAYVFQANRRIYDWCRTRGESLLVPEPFGYIPEWGLSFQEEVAGSHPAPLAGPPREWYSLLSRVAEGLRSFHRSSIAGLTPCPLDQVFEDLRLSATEAANVLPESEKILMGLLEEFEKDLPTQGVPELRPVHGDFHVNQILLGDRGPVIIDLDAVRLSDSLEDVANFTAHLMIYRKDGLLSRQEDEEAEGRFLRDYFEGDDLKDHQAGYRWHKKAALTRLALSCLKYLPMDWRARMEFFMDEAGRVTLS